MVYGLIHEMQQDRQNDRGRLRLMEGMLCELQKPKVQHIQACLHLDKLKKIDNMKDWSCQSLRSICMFVEDTKELLKDSDCTYRIMHNSSHQVQYCSGDMQKNGDIFNMHIDGSPR